MVLKARSSTTKFISEPKEAFIKRYNDIVERTNKAEMRPDEEQE